MVVVKVDNVSKSYTRHSFKGLFRREKSIIHALRDIFFELNEGESVCIVGENGSGKSTLIKLILGIMPPSSGRVEVFGLDPFKHREKVCKKYGVVFGQRSFLFPFVPIIESFNVQREIYKIDKNEFQERLEEITTTLGIKDLLNLTPEKLSLGQRMRCEIACALIHNPKLIVLDEPTIGLDVVVRKKIIDYLKAVRKKGTSIIFSTHLLTDVEMMGGKILFLSNGRMIFHGDISEFMKKFGGRKTIVLKLKKEMNESQLKNILNDIGKIEDIHIDKKEVRLLIKHSSNKDTILKQLIEFFEIEELQVKEPSLEEIVREVINSVNGAENPV